MDDWWIVSVNFLPPYVTQTSDPATIPGLTGEDGPFRTRAEAEAGVPSSGLGSGAPTGPPTGTAKPPAPHTLPGYSLAGPWYYNSESGKVEYVTNWFFKLSGRISASLPLDWYGWKTQQDMLNAIATEGWKAPTTSIVKGVENSAGQQASDVTGGLSGLLPQFQNTRGLAVRAIKVVVGVGLVFLGLVQLTHISQQVLPAAAKGLALAA